MLDSMVRHGLFVEWTFVQEKLKDVKGEPSEDPGEEPLWQREKKMQRCERGVMTARQGPGMQGMSTI